MLETERIGNVLWITGAILPAEEKTLQEAIRRFVDEVKGPGRALEMSGVQFLSASSARELVAIGQEVAEGGEKLKVRASLPVFHRLNALGAGTWLDIETCQKPNPKPPRLPTSPIGKRDSSPRLPAATPLTGAKENGKPPMPAPPPTHGVTAPVSGGPTQEVTVHPVEPEHVSSVGLNRPGGSAIGRAPVAGSPAEQALLASAQARAGQPLVADDAEVGEDLALLRLLVVMRTYTLQIPAAKQDITGKILARVGGPWILVDSHGARKIVNMRLVAVVDILA
jgi:hypothetical protein